MNKRVFFAINLPFKIRDRIAQEILELIPQNKTKKVERKNLHLTISFIGSVSQEQLREIIQKIEPIRKEKKFPVELTDFGQFNNKVLWLGVKKGNEEMNSLRAKVVRLTETKDEQFHPHVTLARNKHLKPKTVDRILEKINSTDFSEEFIVKSLDLMESVLTKKGPKYSIIERVALN